MSYREQQDKTLKSFLTRVAEDRTLGGLAESEYSDGQVERFLQRYTRDTKYAGELMDFYRGELKRVGEEGTV